MQAQLGIWKKFIRSLLVVDRCSLNWGSERGLLEVYQWWTDAASAGDFEEVYQKFGGGGQMQPQLGIWKSFITSLSGVDKCRLSCGFGRGLLEFYWLMTDAASAGDLEEVCQKFIRGGQMQPQLVIQKRFIRILLGWTNSVSAVDLEEIYQKFIGGGQMQPQMGIWKMFIRSFSGVARCNLSQGSGRG